MISLHENGSLRMQEEFIKMDILHENILRIYNISNWRN